MANIVNFNPNEPLDYVKYGRHSDSHQNPRSCEQQFAETDGRIKRRGLPWNCVGTYRDEAISGRYSRRRPGYQQMIRDLKSGAVRAQAIIVDTRDRLGRAREFAAQAEKFRRLSVLILSANTDFADPTTSAGQVFAFMDQYRATEESIVKGYQVLRGKRDAIGQHFWPGGAPPFGFRLEPVLVPGRKPPRNFQMRLVPDESTSWIPAAAFEIAAKTGWGRGRVTQALNEDPRIPEEYKPFYPDTIAGWLKNPLYIGDLEWGKEMTDIVDDVRKSKPRERDEWTIYKSFCEPLVPVEQWETVQQFAAQRSERAAALKGRRSNGRGIDGVAAQGIALKYPLSGLVRCSHCRRSMIASSSALYATLTGEERRYVAYKCPRSGSRHCTNSKRIPEDWLRGVVMELLRRRVFFDDRACASKERVDDVDCPACMTVEQVSANPSFLQLMSEVQQALQELDSQSPDEVQRMELERRRLGLDIHGWLRSLADPSLVDSVRTSIQGMIAEAQSRQRSIADELANRESLLVQCQSIATPESVVDELNRLERVLSGDSASATNAMLAQHIDGIYCDSGGKVTVRTCRLGALSEVTELLSKQFSGPAIAVQRDPNHIVPRHRTRLDLGAAIEDDDEADAVNDFAVDPHRFAGLDDCWFCEDVFVVPKSRSWAALNAAAVAEYRLSTHHSMERTAKHFGKSSPTILAALNHAKAELGIDALGKCVSRATLPNWSKAYAAEVFAYVESGKLLKEAVIHFGKSEPTLRKAIQHHKENLSIGKGDA